MRFLRVVLKPLVMSFFTFRRTMITMLAKLFITIVQYLFSIFIFYDLNVFIILSVDNTLMINQLPYIVRKTVCIKPFR